MNSLKRQDGIAQVLIVVLVAIVLVAIGLAIWQSQQAKTNADRAASSPTPASVTQASSTPAPSATPASNLFVVKELGVQFKVSSDITDLVYVAQTHNGQTAAYFSSTSLEAADKNTGGKYCTPGADAPVGTIDLSTTTPAGEQAIKTIGGKYLNYARPQSVCSQDSSVMSLASKQAQAFIQALSSAEAIQ